jgi:hypothetical protein
MGGTEKPISIPAVLVASEAGDLLRDIVQEGSKLRLIIRTSRLACSSCLVVFVASTRASSSCFAVIRGQPLLT